MSSLPAAQWCGQASRLSSISCQVVALQGSAFHALCAAPEAPETKSMLARLGESERNEVLSWKQPEDLTIGDVLLKYENASKEVEVGLDASGEYCAPTSPDCISVGHCDFFWLSGETAYVIDIKRSEYTNADGPESLQFHAYALAIASRCNARYYVTAQWSAIEGTWWWLERAIDVWSPEADSIRARVVASALNVGGSHVVGSHCRSCYGRDHCPAWLMPLELAETSLKPLTDGAEPSEEEELALLILAERAADTAKKARDILKERAIKRGGIYDPATKKRWAAIRMPGRKSLDLVSLKAAGVNPDDHQRLGSAYDQMRWVKA